MRDPRDQFGPVAESYLTSAVHSNPTALSRLVELVQPRGGAVIDIATGAGHTAFAFAPHVDRVIATDITPDMLRVTRSAAAERNLSNLDVLFAKAEALPFGSASVEGITCRMGAHHFEDARAFLIESKRALKQGGWFLLVDTVGSEDSSADEQVDRLERVRDPSHVRSYTRSFWLQLAKSVGLEVTHEEINLKVIDSEDWMERMQVSPPDRVALREMIQSAKGEFRNYLQPEMNDGRQIFHLAEMALLARA